MKRNGREYQYLGSGVFREKKQRASHLAGHELGMHSNNNQRRCVWLSFTGAWAPGSRRSKLQAVRRKILSRRETQPDFHRERWLGSNRIVSGLGQEEDQV